MDSMNATKTIGEMLDSMGIRKDRMLAAIDSIYTGFAQLDEDEQFEDDERGGVSPSEGMIAAAWVLCECVISRGGTPELLAGMVKGLAQSLIEAKNSAAYIKKNLN